MVVPRQKKTPDAKRVRQMRRDKPMQNPSTTAPMSKPPNTTRDTEQTPLPLARTWGAWDATLCSREHTRALAPRGSRPSVPAHAHLPRAPIQNTVSPWPTVQPTRALPRGPGPQTVIAIARNPVLDGAQWRSADTARCRPRTRPERNVAQAIMMLSLGVIAGILIATCAYPIRSGALRLARHISTMHTLGA